MTESLLRIGTGIFLGTCFAIWVTLIAITFFSADQFLVVLLDRVVR